MVSSENGVVMVTSLTRPGIDRSMWRSRSKPAWPGTDHPSFGAPKLPGA
ncbi:MAG: hypothetical protein ACI9K2_006910 [Myxococcota bacterium]|jgi:hypothetical protein